MSTMEQQMQSIMEEPQYYDGIILLYDKNNNYDKMSNFMYNYILKKCQKKLDKKDYLLCSNIELTNVVLENEKFYIVYRYNEANTWWTDNYNISYEKYLLLERKEKIKKLKN